MASTSPLDRLRAAAEAAGSPLPGPVPTSAATLTATGFRNAVTPLGREPLTALLRTRTAAELIADDSLAKDAGWIVEGLLVKGINVPYGAPKVGKGTLMTYVAAKVADGATCLGRVVHGGPVLWIDLEQGYRLTRRKLAEARAEATQHPIHVYAGPVPSLEAVEARIHATGAVLLVIDSASRFLRLEDENDNAQMTAALAPLVELAQRLDICIVLIHHDRKSGGDHGAGMRGASAMLAVVDVAIHIKRESGEDETLRRLSCLSRYDEANGQIVVRRIQSGFELVGTPAEMRRDRIISVLRERGEMVADEVAAVLDVSRPLVAQDLAALRTAGHVDRAGSGKKGDPHRYSAAKDDAVTENRSSRVTALQNPCADCGELPANPDGFCDRCRRDGV